MADIFTYTFFIIGLILIIKGGDIFVDSATNTAKILKIPKFIIGATIVSIATTLPEIIVSVQATLSQNVDMAVGNAIGSVTANTALTALKKKSSTLSAGNILGANIIDLTLILPLCSLISIAKGTGELAVSASSVSFDMVM